MKLTDEKLQQVLSKSNYSISTTDFRSRSAPELEPNFIHEPLAKAPLQKANSPRIRVTVNSVRKRLLDEDNECSKFLVDQLRYAGIILNDNPSLTTISTTQRKCEAGEPEYVEIIVQEI